MTLFYGLLQRTFRIRPDEVSQVFFSGLLFYTLMTSYNILKPIRDTMGLAGTALVTVPLSLVWGAVGFYLGRRQKQLAAADRD